MRHFPPPFMCVCVVYSVCVVYRVCVVYVCVYLVVYGCVCVCGVV